MKKILFILSLYLLFFSNIAHALEPMKIVYYDNYPPRSWKESGEMKGILVDVITEALHNRLGIPLTHEGYPWTRAQAMVKNNKADAFISIPTKARGSYTEVSLEPVIEFELFISTWKR